MLRNIKTEGHYTIKRVDKLPEKGNANWLYVIRASIIDRLYRWDAFDKEWEVIYINSQGFIPEDTVLNFDSNTNVLSITFTDGMTKSTVLDIKGYVTTYTDNTGLEKSKIGEYLNEDTAITEVFETNTNIRLEGNNIVYNREDDTETIVDLTHILDQALDVALASATYVESLSTIVLTLNNGQNISVTLTGLGGNSIPQTLTLTGTDLSISEGNTVDLSSLTTSITSTSELINDGSDSVNPFITQNDIPDETLTSLGITGNTLNYTDENGDVNDIVLPTSSGGSGVSSVVAGTNITVDNTDPSNPIINSNLPVDFYEEGIYTPSFNVASSNYTSTYSSGSYTRIGNFVTLNVYFEGVVGNTGQIVVDLPYIATSSNSLDFFPQRSSELRVILNSNLTVEEVNEIRVVPQQNSIFFIKVDSDTTTSVRDIIFNTDGKIEARVSYMTNVYTP